MSGNEKNHAGRSKKSVRKGEECLEEQGNPAPADQDQDYRNDQEEVNQQFPEGHFLPGCLQLYHITVLFIAQRIYRVCQSRPHRLVTD